MAYGLDPAHGSLGQHHTLHRECTGPSPCATRGRQAGPGTAPAAHSTGLVRVIRGMRRPCQASLVHWLQGQCRSGCARARPQGWSSMRGTCLIQWKAGPGAVDTAHSMVLFLIWPANWPSQFDTPVLKGCFQSFCHHVSVSEVCSFLCHDLGSKHFYN